MKSELKDALAAYLLALADDELILGHRDSEWCGHAPILEEDIAFANIALDEIGHAMIWYGILTDLLGEDQETYPDRLVYQRDGVDFRPTQFVELPKGDWAFSMLRQYLFDSAEKLRLEAMLTSQYTPIAEAAAKIRTEEIYHLRHTSAWVRRLGLGTAESNLRMQRALNELWRFALQLFEGTSDERLLVEAGFVPDTSVLRTEWMKAVSEHLRAAGLRVPEKTICGIDSREDHSEYLLPLVKTLQEVSRLYPDARW